MADEGTTRKTKYRNRMKGLFEASSSWLVHWRELAEYLMPRRGKYLQNNQTDTDKQRGEKRHQKIINGSASGALRTIAAGMQGGLTSPSRAWFQLVLGDEELMEISPVRNWLHIVRNQMLNVFQRSNFYGSIHGVYKELAGFGTAAMLIEEDLETVIRCRPFTIGEYRLILDAKYRPIGFFRKFSMTAVQIVERFAKGTEEGKKPKNISQKVWSAAQLSSKKDSWHEVVHCLKPKDNIDRRGMSYESVYFELEGDPGEDQFLSDGGYRTKPFVAPRWEVTGVNIYGDSPGMEALGDVKMLQKLESDKLKAIAKEVNPPMNAPLSMRGKGGTIIPGGINYHDITTGTAGFSPAYQVKMDIQGISVEIARVEDRIKNFFFNDLFLAVLGTEKEMTATEVAQRHEEKMLMLGPVIERLEAELLDTIIERTYSIMDNLGMLPPVPEELSGREIEIKYISLLSQAQRIVGISTIERTAQFVAGLSEVYPSVLDKFDADEAVDQFSSMVGIPPKIIISDDKVAEKRAADAEAAQQMQAAEAAAQGAESAKTLSETELDKGSALDAVLEQEGAA